MAHKTIKKDVCSGSTKVPQSKATRMFEEMIDNSIDSSSGLFLSLFSTHKRWVFVHNE